MFILYSGARQIKALKVKCDNLDNGCKWIGELGSLDEHMQKCGFTPVFCTNQCKSGTILVKVLRKNLNDHVTNKCLRRQFQCQHCNENGEYEERKTTHLKICPKVKVQCPNDNCQVSIPRCEVATHQSTCPYERVPCKYAEVGCEEKPLRKDLKTHEEDDQLHLRITTEKVLELTKQNADLETKLLKRTTIFHFTFKLTNYQKHKEDDDVFYSPPFYTSPTGYEMCIGVDANGDGDGKGTHVTLFAHLMKGDNDDSLTWPFTGSVTFELLNQLEDKNHYKNFVTFPAVDTYSKRVVEGKRGAGWGIDFIRHTELDFNHDKGHQYLKDNTLIFRISVDVPDYKPWLECTV